MKLTVSALCFAVLLWCAGPAAELWKFDSLTSIGGHPVTVVGHPQIISTPAGKAIQFGGVEDALFLNVHPLAGAETFTWEVIFRPDPGGKPEQRFFHLQEEGSNTRLLFEIRIVDDKWCLDSFALAGTESKPLLNREKLHPLGVWHAAAAVYDGREYRNYVDGELEGSAPLHLIPQKAGRTSIGTRINRVDYFKGAVLLARMTRGALPVSEFLKAPR
jgi:Concanavalin A-like lectin/glucanases superfamily